MGRRLVIIRQSARKHGISDNDILAALATPLLAGPLDDDHPQRVLTLGFDSQARVLDWSLCITTTAVPKSFTQ